MTTGEKIRAARKSVNLTQKELAERLGISSVGISQWENNLRNPKLSTLSRIADVLDIPVSLLLDNDKDDENAFPPEILDADIETTQIPVEKSIADALRRVSESNGRRFEDEVNEAIDFYLSTLERTHKVDANQALWTDGSKGPQKLPPKIAAEIIRQHNMMRFFGLLNAEGQEKVVAQIEALKDIPQYTKYYDELLPEYKDKVDKGQWKDLWDWLLNLK